MEEADDEKWHHISDGEDHDDDGEEGEDVEVDMDEDDDDVRYDPNAAAAAAAAARGREYDFNSDSDEEGDPLNQVADTTAQQARMGRDVQGIPWDRLAFTRKKYRETRLQQYKNYQNLEVDLAEFRKTCPDFKNPTKANFFDFEYNARAGKSTVYHFQLRNLVWATSPHDIYVMHQYGINHWSPLSRKLTQVLNVAGPVVPLGELNRHAWAMDHGVGRVQITTMCRRRNLLVAGGFHGEMVCKNLESAGGGVVHSARVTHDENAITNAIDVFDSPAGAARIMTSNNDCMVRIFDGETFAPVERFPFSWPVNHTCVHPDGKRVLVVGDDPEGLIVDCQSGKTIANLKGHVDFSFATAWHREGHLFATGNQDMTCRVWDARKTATSLFALKANVGAIRSIRFSDNGRFMAMSEPADFVHIFDVHRDFNRYQEIDLFGEISGISFSPDTEAFFVGISDRTYGSLLEYNRRSNYSALAMNYL